MKYAQLQKLRFNCACTKYGIFPFMIQQSDKTTYLLMAVQQRENSTRYQLYNELHFNCFQTVTKWLRIEFSTNYNFCPKLQNLNTKFIKDTNIINAHT